MGRFRRYGRRSALRDDGGGAMSGCGCLERRADGRPERQGRHGDGGDTEGRAGRREFVAFMANLLSGFLVLGPWMQRVGDPDSTFSRAPAVVLGITSAS
jgi:hypothetical protein